MQAIAISLDHFPKNPTINDLRKITPWADLEYKKARDERDNLESLAKLALITSTVFATIVVMGILANDSLVDHGIPLSDPLYGRAILIFSSPAIALYGIGMLAYGISKLQKRQKNYPQLKQSEINAIASLYKNPQQSEESHLAEKLQEAENQKNIKQQLTLAELAKSSAYAKAKISRANRSLYWSAGLLSGAALITALVALMALANIVDTHTHLSPQEALKWIGIYSTPAFLPFACGLYKLGAYLTKKGKHHTHCLTDSELNRFYQKQRNWILYHAGPQDQKLVLEAIQSHCARAVRFAEEESE